MDLNAKLEALEKQAEELKAMFMKVVGAIELTKTLIAEEEKPEEEKPAEENKEGQQWPEQKSQY